MERGQEERLTGLCSIAQRKFFNAVGYSGALLILYSVVSIAKGAYWQPLERWIRFSSALLTLVATILTAGSIYPRAGRQTHTPERFSKLISGPIVIGSALVAIAVLIWHGSLPDHVTTGFTLLVIAGAWFRIQPKTIE